MLASLPMYDLEEVHAASDALWTALAAHLRAVGAARVPEHLERGTHAADWTAPDLLLSQTCGYPLTHALAGRVRYLATPCYAARGCAGGWYRSAVLVHFRSPACALAHLRGGVCAYNAVDSHSGYNALRALLAPLARDGRFFGRALATGAHVASIAAVASGAADCCAVDCVSHALLARHRRAALADTRVIAWSPPAPGLPWITAASASTVRVATLRRALAGVLADPALAGSRAALLLDGMEVLPESRYGVIPALEVRARAAGYPVLA